MNTSIIQSIQGIFGGPSQNGANIALDVSTQVIQFLRAHQTFSYMFCSMHPAYEMVGSVFYRKIQTAQMYDYKNGLANFQEPQFDMVQVNLDQFHTAKWTVESFNLARIRTADELIGQFVSTIALALQLRLNALFLSELKWHTLATDAEAQQANIQQNTYNYPQAINQFIKVKALGTTDYTDAQMALNGDFGTQIKVDYMAIVSAMLSLSKIYNKEAAGIDLNDFYCIMSPHVPMSLQAAFFSAPFGDYSTRIGLGDITIHKFNQLKFVTEPMLDNQVTHGSAFEAEWDLDMRNVIGFIIHREAVAFPVGNVISWVTRDQQNNNILSGMKVMSGFGLIRPGLVAAIVRDGATINVANPFKIRSNDAINRTFNDAAVPVTMGAGMIKTPNPSAYIQPAVIVNPTPNTNQDDTISPSATPAAPKVTRNLDE